MPLLRDPIPMNLSILLSSIVLLVPNLTRQSSCMYMSSCSHSSKKPVSPLANANVGFPVAGLSFIGTTTPSSSKITANCWLLANFFLTHSSSSQPSFSMRPLSMAFFSSLTSSRRSCNSASSTSKTGSVYMRRVKSMSLTSLSLKFGANTPKSLYVSSTSFLQYSPYCFKSGSVKSSSRLPLASTTSVPLRPNSYRSTKADKEPPASTP